MTMVNQRLFVYCVGGIEGGPKHRRIEVAMIESRLDENGVQYIEDTTSFADSPARELDRMVQMHRRHPDRSYESGRAYMYRFPKGRHFPDGLTMRYAPGPSAMIGEIAADESFDWHFICRKTACPLHVKLPNSSVARAVPRAITAGRLEVTPEQLAQFAR